MSRSQIGGYVHHALFFGSDAELLQVAVPFLQEGLAAGDADVLGCEDRKNRLLADALDRDPRVRSLERSSTYLRVAVAVAAYRRMLEHQLAAGARRVRLVGEVDFGRDPGAWSEWVRYEASATSPWPPTRPCRSAPTTPAPCPSRSSPPGAAPTPTC